MTIAFPKLRLVSLEFVSGPTLPPHRSLLKPVTSRASHTRPHVALTEQVLKLLLSYMLIAGFPRISVDPLVCGGKPTVARTRVRVTDVLDMLAGRATPAEIVSDFPYLTEQDVLAVLAYAAARLNTRLCSRRNEFSCRRAAAARAVCLDSRSRRTVVHARR